MSDDRHALAGMALRIGGDFQMAGDMMMLIGIGIAHQGQRRL